jgi:nucleoside-diphosphate-sugar epimerase
VIIGKGMIAGAIEGMSGWESDILFSSGVSNSGERDRSAFQKELDLVECFLQKVQAGAAFVYFSTTSIFDPEKVDSPYIVHKLHIEQLIKESNNNYLIIRLPNLVGRSKNPHTLTNFFAQSIRTGSPIRLKANAVRHLIDVADLATILNDIKTKFGKQKITVNVETDRPLTAEKILLLMEEVMSKKAGIIPLPAAKKGTETLIPADNSSIHYLFNTNENYHRDLFRKYYSG